MGEGGYTSSLLFFSSLFSLLLLNRVTYQFQGRAVSSWSSVAARKSGAVSLSRLTRRRTLKMPTRKIIHGCPTPDIHIQDIGVVSFDENAVKTLYNSLSLRGLYGVSIASASERKGFSYAIK
jgi:hypothetical protein